MRKCLVETVLLPVLLQPAVQLCSCLSLRIHYHQGTNKLMIMMIFSLISMLSLSSSVAAVDIPLANYSGTSNYRFLQNQNSDWQAFNDLIYNAVVRFPDSSMKNAGLTLKVKNLQCTNIQLTDITVGSSQTSAQEVVVSTTISGLNMVCNADYEFEGWLFVGGSGNLYLESFNNQAVLQTAFDSLNYNQYPPHDTSIKACQPTININTLDFSNGGFLGWTLDQLQSMFRGRFESMAEDRFCAELDQMSNENMDTLLNDLSNRLAQYPADIVIDPLQPEKNDLLGPATANVYFIDWQKPESYAYGVWMDQAWQEIAKFLNQEVALGPSGQVDKNANQLLREHILEEDGVLVMTMEDEEQNILFEDHDQWTQTRVTVNEIRVEGLDTLTNLDPMVYIGKYTMQSNLVWEKLMFEVDMTMEIKPSTIPGSYITGATSSGITEHVTVEFSMSQVQASIAILLAINQKKLEALQVGHFLDRDQILPCLLSSIYKVEVASFSVEVLDLEPPRLSGFVSRGLDRVVSKAVEAAFLMYEASLLRSSRAFFQTAIRKVVNEKVEAQYASYGQTKCVLWELPSAPGAVDFRDLLLEPDQAVLFGGSGTERYGNLFSTFVMPTMREHILTEDKMNENILRPYTLTQSGEEGVVLAVSPLHQYVQETGSQLNSTWISLLGWDRFELKIFDSAVRNIDTIVSPIEILEPLMNAQKLSNTLRTGASRPLTFSSRFSLFAQSNDANLEMYNELDMSLSIPSSLISFNLLTALNETSLLQFPLKDLTNQFCWLSALFDQANVENEALDLQGILISFSSFDFDLACISCSSPGSVYLSEIISEIKNADFLTLIRPNIEGAMTEVALNAWENMNTTGMIRDAANLCPHNPSFKPTSVAKRSYGWSNSLTTFSWSQKSVETLVTMGYVALVAAAIVVSENHLLQEGQDPVADSESDFGWNQTTAGYNFSGIRLLDWSNLSATVGLWADGALKDALQYLKEPVAIKASVHTKQSTSLGTNSSRQDEYSTEDFRANALIREFLLDDDGILYLPFDNIHFEVAGIDVQLQEARIVGLDSIVELDAFNITGPQTLQYYLSLRSLDMVLKLQVRSDQVFRNMSLFLSFDDIVADLSMVLAIDLDKLGIMELRSLLKTSNIIPCLIQGAAHEVFISNLHVSIGKMDEPVFDGITSPSLRHAITSVEKSLFSKYTEDIRAAVPGIFDTTLRTLFNDKLKELVLRQSTESCSVNLDSDHFLDFRDLFLPAALARSHGGSGRVPYGDLFEKMYQVLNHELTKKDNDGGLTINTLVSSWTSDQSNSSGVLAFPGDLLETSANLKFGGLDAVLGLRLSEVYIFNLNSLGSPISIFDPVERHSLNNTVSVGIGPEPLVVNANILFTLSDNEEMQINNEVEVNIDLHSVTTFVEVLLKIREQKFLNFPLRDIPNIYCWLATIFAPTGASMNPRERGIALEDYAFLVDSLNLNISCISCTSPLFGNLLSDLYTPSDSEDATDTVKQTAGQVLDGDAIQSFFDQFVSDSSKNCPHSSDYDPNASELVTEYMKNPAKPFGLADFSVRDSRSSYFNIANGIFAGLLLALLVGGKWWVHRRNNEWKQSLSDEGAFLLRRQGAKENEEEAILDFYGSSLFRDPHIPIKIRLLVPVMMVINIGLYLGGHCGVLSTVDVDVQLAGEEFTIHQMLDFSFFSSTAKTYQNGGMEMSIMLWLFGFIWPYVKLFASLFLWFVPPRVLSVAKRGTLLLWIDALTKLSIIDIFTLVLSLALFLVYIGGPDDSLSSSDLFAMKVIVVPGASFYCIVVAQRISRTSSRLFLDYHNKALAAAREAIERGDIMDVYDVSSVEDKRVDNDQEEPTQGEGRIGKVGQNRQSTNSLCCTVTTEADGDTTIENYGSIHAASNFNEMAAVPEEEGEEGEASETRKYFRGQLGVLFGGLTVLTLGIIGCIFAPSLAIEISDLWGLILESEATHRDAISDYGVFSIVTAILLKTRFVLDSTWDYVALGFLMTVGVISIGGVFFMSCYRVIQILLDKGWAFFQDQGSPLYYQLPSYLRLYAYKHIEIYVVAVVIGCWQLGAVSIYAIHLYCSILNTVYKLLSYIGLAERPSAECFPIQMTQPDNLLVFLGSFCILLANFVVQVFTQYRKNIREASHSLHQQEHDMERLSTLWNAPSSNIGSVRDEGKEQTRRALHLNQTASFSDDDDDDGGGNDSSNSDASASTTSFVSVRSSSPLVLKHKNEGSSSD